MPRPWITFITGQYVPRCQHDIDKHFSEYQTLQYMDAGSVSLRIGEQSYVLKGRWFWSAYPGPRISFRSIEKGGYWVHRYLAFRGPLVTRWEEDGLFPVLPQQAPLDQDWASRFDDLIGRVSHTGYWDVVRTGHEVESLLIDLASARAQKPLSGWVRSLAKNLSEPAGGGVDYESLAGKLGMSVRSLRRNFKRKLGVSPHQFLIEQRVRHARQKLLETDVPIKQIARELGYSDVYYFSRQFKHLTGISPAAFRLSREG